MDRWSRSSLLALSIGAGVALFAFAVDISRLQVPLTAVDVYPTHGQSIIGRLSSVKWYIRHLLRSLVAFHMLATDQTNKSACSYMRERITQIAFVLILIFTEGRRADASRRLSCFSKIWIALLHPVTFPILFPLFCYFDLVPQTDRERRLARFALSEADLANLFFSMFLGFGIPAIMMFDPFEQGVYVQMKWTRLFVMSPLNVAVAQFVFESVVPPRAFNGILDWLRMTSHETLQCAHVVLGVVSSSFHSVALTGMCFAAYDMIQGAPLAEPEPLYDRLVMYRAIEVFFTTASLVIWTFSKTKLNYPWHKATLFSAFTLGTIVCGPVSTLGAVWSRHERVMMDNPEHEMPE